MRIAFCIVGQPRHWKICYQNWAEIFGVWGEIDVFFHFWDFTTAPLSVADGIKHQLSEDDKNEIIRTLQPKKFQFESDFNISIQDDKNNVQCPVPYWSVPQFMSLQKCANLKRQYEIENDFSYDIVIKLRSDIFFSTTFGESYAPYVLQDNWFRALAPSTIYSIHSTNSTPIIRMSDIFFIADSLTFDHIALFYKSFRYLDLHDILGADHNGFSPEFYFYYYLHSIGITNHPLPNIDVRLYRDKDYFDKVNGALGNHEIHF